MANTQEGASTPASPGTAPLVKLAAIGLIVVGLSQMLGYAAGRPRLELLGKMTGAAPLPLVFDLVDGVEYWAFRHELEIVAPERLIEMRSTPELFARIRGPHVVKISYILPLALAPVLPDEFRDPLLQRAFCGRGKLARDFELPAGISEIRLTVTHPRGRGAWRFVVECPR